MARRTKWASRLAVACCLLYAILSASRAAADTLRFDFNDGTYQGWTNFRSSTSPPLAFTPNNEAGVGGRPSNPSGAYMITPEPFANRDGPHTTLLARSPEFFLDGSGDLTIQLAGGEGQGTTQGTLPVSPFSLAANTTPATSGVHATGIGLYYLPTSGVPEPAYLATAQKPAEGADFVTVTIPEATLDDLFARRPNDTYRLDVYDSFEGGWGWIAFDNVNIPGRLVPEPAAGALVLLAAAALALGRVKRG